MKHDKLVGTAKKLDKFLWGIQIVNVVAVILVTIGVLILSIAYWANPVSVNVADVVTVSLGEITLELANAGTGELGVDLPYAWICCLVIVVELMLLWVGFYYIRRIMTQMMKGNPFDISVSDNLKKLSYLSLVHGMVGNIGSAAMLHAKIRHYDLMKLADSEQIVSVTADYTLDLNFLITFLVLLLAAYIFRYGAELQQLSDETL